VHSLELVEWKGDAHPYRWPEKAFSEQKRALAQSLSSVDPAAGAPIAAAAVDPEMEEACETVGSEGSSTSSDDVPTAFVLQMHVSGGTYVRSIVHELARALGSAGHVVTLTRSRQRNYVLEPKEEDDRGCVPWEVFEAALEDAGEKDADGWTAWEREVLDKLDIVDGGGGKSGHDIAPQPKSSTDP
jgi:tRNA pseudouridine55 synthase